MTQCVAQTFMTARSQPTAYVANTMEQGSSISHTGKIFCMCSDCKADTSGEGAWVDNMSVWEWHQCRDRAHTASRTPSTSRYPHSPGSGHLDVPKRPLIRPRPIEVPRTLISLRGRGTPSRTTSATHPPAIVKLDTFRRDTSNLGRGDGRPRGSRGRASHGSSVRGHLREDSTTTAERRRDKMVTNDQGLLLSLLLLYRISLAAITCLTTSS